MKGVSLAIETVVFIILAVLVLTILLFFFTSQSGPAQQEISLQRQRAEICGRIATADPKCENFNGITSSDLNDLTDKVCVGIKLCTAGEDDAACVKKCCTIFCPR
ncbi:MAG: hypothetical protein HYT73_01760 [Candidatus Aenigmarchaeota archaeon]|nr:hypothetical protein [Candidatus Aenigmarchaeota archaeon]